MAVMRSGASLTRRRFLTTAASSAAMAAAGGIAKPALSRAADRPVITHGVQSGDVSVDSGVVWARADRASRMLVEVATSESFKDIRSAVAVDALLETDFTAKALLEGLPAAGRVLSHSLPGSFVSDRARFAAGRAFSHGAERTAHHLVRLVGRYRRRRLRHRRGARGHAHLFNHVEIPARFFHSLWRPHLRRLPAARGAQASERRGVEERRH